MKKTLKRLQSVTANDSAATAVLNDNFASIEEAIDNSVSRNGVAPNYMQANLDMNNNRIINVADPVDDGDVVTYRKIKEGFTAAIQAEQSAAAAQASASQAAISAQSSGISAITASNNSTLAKDWANKIDGTVDGEEYSAKHYAQEAEEAAYAVGNPANKDLSNITSAGKSVIKSTAVVNSLQDVEYYAWKKQFASGKVYTKERDPGIGDDCYEYSDGEFVLSEYKVSDVNYHFGHVSRIKTTESLYDYIPDADNHVYWSSTEVAPSQKAISDSYTLNDMSNITSTGKKSVSKLLCPSTETTTLVVGATGTKYTAPDTGWFRIRVKDITDVQGNINFSLSCNGVVYTAYRYHSSTSITGSLNTSIPVAKGQEVEISYYLTGATYTADLFFIKALGDA